MVEPVIPAGVTIAALVMTAIGWYGMLRNGVQLVHNDWKAKKQYQMEVEGFMVELVSLERELANWKNEWMISQDTPEKILEVMWGQAERHIIKAKLGEIDANCKEAQKELIKITGLTDNEWEKMAESSKKRRAKFIWTKKAYMENLFGKISKCFDSIDKAARRGWNNHAAHIYGPSSNQHHAHLANLLPTVAWNIAKDLNKFRLVLTDLRSMGIEFDLDLFDSRAAASKDMEASSVTSIAAVSHLRLELLLRSSVHSRTEEVVRATLERAEACHHHQTARQAFVSVMGESQASVHHYFAADAHTKFSLSKSSRSGNPCSPNRESLRTKSAQTLAPRYRHETNDIVIAKLLLDDISTFRAAYELSQACLIFLRTGFANNLCGCGLKCGERTDPVGKCHDFGLSVHVEHERPMWRCPERMVHGRVDDSWCTTLSDNYAWDALTQPLRRLGLLLLELTLGTIITSIRVGANGEITHVVVQCIEEGPRFLRPATLRLEKSLALVKPLVHHSDPFIAAIKSCLTRNLPPVPDDDEFAMVVHDLYLDIVKP